ncbi:GNAT family N-acetyltransferase [Aliihoeflea sp. PC F10.4]
MVPTKMETPHPLSAAHIGEAMELVAEAGWNQLPADWLQFIQRGEVLGIFDGATLVATAAIMPYDNDFAWIGMVLTRKAWRGRGMGTGLLKACIARLEAAGRTAWLDATPAGEPIYRALGFQPVDTFQRWQGVGGSSASSDTGPESMTAIATANVAFGADRTAFLLSLKARCPAAYRATDTGVSFGRDGRIATQIGPVIGSSEDAIIELVDHAIAALDGPVFLDVADRYEQLAEYLRTRGFTTQRPFLRMRRGPHEMPGEAARMAVIAGPEFG